MNPTDDLDPDRPDRDDPEPAGPALDRALEDDDPALSQSLRDLLGPTEGATTRVEAGVGGALRGRSVASAGFDLLLTGWRTAALILGDPPRRSPQYRSHPADGVERNEGPDHED